MTSNSQGLSDDPRKEETSHEGKDDRRERLIVGARRSALGGSTQVLSLSVVESRLRRVRLARTAFLMGEGVDRPAGGPLSDQDA
jgi:hypothetical protein